ncbi:hypothetical protein VP01_808g1 [Puccinia sorghi]|uniref:Uncharacterized protein n=1 Tax=Puccinia sorghi TaxID=27349 RepID=A0A0L6UB41_9BASI|nr:hypothetical protein VP01_808g1 [Puccinia sorghi]
MEEETSEQKVKKRTEKTRLSQSYHTEHEVQQDIQESEVIAPACNCHGNIPGVFFITVKAIIHKTPFSINRLNSSQQPQSRKLNKTNTTFSKNKNLLTVKFMILLQRESWKKNKTLVDLLNIQVDLLNTQVDLLNTQSLEGQPDILCKLILFFSSSEDEPLLLPLSPKHVFKSAKATVLSFCLCVLLNYRDKTPLPKAGILLTDLSTMHFDCIIAKAFFNLGGGFCMGCQLKLGPSSPKIRLNLCKTYTQFTVGIISVYDQVNRKHLHANAMEKAQVYARQKLLNEKLVKTPSPHKKENICYVPRDHEIIVCDLKNMLFGEIVTKCQIIRYYNGGIFQFDAWHWTLWKKKIDGLSERSREYIINHMDQATSLSLRHVRKQLGVEYWKGIVNLQSHLESFHSPKYSINILPRAEEENPFRFSCNPILILFEPGSNRGTAFELQNYFLDHLLLLCSLSLFDVIQLSLPRHVQFE